MTEHAWEILALSDILMVATAVSMLAVWFIHGPIDRAISRLLHIDPRIIYSRFVRWMEKERHLHREPRHAE